MDKDDAKQASALKKIWKAEKAKDFEAMNQWNRKNQGGGVVNITVEDSVGHSRITIVCGNFPPRSAFKKKERFEGEWVPPQGGDSGYLEFIYENYPNNNGKKIDYLYRIEPRPSKSKKREIKCEAVGIVPETWDAEEG